MLVLGSMASYGITVFLFLPCLFLLSRSHQLTGLKVSLLGLVLGTVVVMPLPLITWIAGGPDTRRLFGNFFVFFLRWAGDPIVALFPLAGLITAGLYWRLAKRRTGRSDSVQ